MQITHFLKLIQKLMSSDTFRSESKRLLFEICIAALSPATFIYVNTTGRTLPVSVNPNQGCLLTAVQTPPDF